MSWESDKATADLRRAFPTDAANTVPRPFRTGTQVLLELEAEIRRQQTEKELIFHLLNESQRLLQFRQAFLLRRQGIKDEFHVIGISSLATVDRNVLEVRRIERLASAIPVSTEDPSAVQLLQARVDNASDDSEVTTSTPFPHALWIPMRAQANQVGGGALLFAATPWDSAQQMIARRLGETYTHAWQALTGPEPAWRRWRFERREKLITAAAALLLCVFPVSMSSLAPMEISAADPAVVAAPLTGVVAEILVPPNTHVKAGQPILRFENTKLRNELTLAQRKVEIATARFGTTVQAAIDSSDANREMAANKAELELALAQQEYARDLMAKSVLRAPVDGIAVYSDRRDWQGRPVETGQQIMKIANPASTEFSIFLPVQDGLLIREGARVKVYLDSSPMHAIDAQLLRASYHAEKTEAGVLAFRLAARANKPLPADIRIGTRGTAQLYGDKVPLLFYLLRRPITVARQTLGW